MVAAAPCRTWSTSVSGVLARLTRFETEILTKLAYGATYHEIAHDLSVSPRTVGSHVQNIATKVRK